MGAAGWFAAGVLTGTTLASLGAVVAELRIRRHNAAQAFRGVIRPAHRPGRQRWSTDEHERHPS